MCRARWHRSAHGNVRGWRWLLAAALLLMAPAAFPVDKGFLEPEKPPGQIRPGRPVHIQSEQLVVDMSGDTAEFSGQVRIVDETSTLTADKVMIVFSPPAGEDEDRLNTELSTAEIRRMIARGGVRIRKSDGTAAEADEVIIENMSSVVTLVGSDAVIMGPGLVLRGSRIILNQKEGDLKAESAPHSRVRVTVIAAPPGN